LIFTSTSSHLYLEEENELKQAFAVRPQKNIFLVLFYSKHGQCELLFYSTEASSGEQFFVFKRETKHNYKWIAQLC
jgi:hypothetical protein